MVIKFWYFNFETKLIFFWFHINDWIKGYERNVVYHQIYKKSIINFLSGLYFCVLLLIDPKWVLNVVPHQKKSNSKLQLKYPPSLQVVKYSYFIFASEKNINLCGCRMCSIFGRGCVNFIWFIFNVEASTCRPLFRAPALWRATQANGCGLVVLLQGDRKSKHKNACTHPENPPPSNQITATHEQGAFLSAHVENQLKIREFLRWTTFVPISLLKLRATHCPTLLV